jgi:hypothetical protein
MENPVEPDLNFGASQSPAGKTAGLSALRERPINRPDQWVGFFHQPSTGWSICPLGKQAKSLLKKRFPVVSEMCGYQWFHPWLYYCHTFGVKESILYTQLLFLN